MVVLCLVSEEECRRMQALEAIGILHRAKCATAATASHQEVGSVYGVSLSHFPLHIIGNISCTLQFQKGMSLRSLQVVVICTYLFEVTCVYGNFAL